MRVTAKLLLPVLLAGAIISTAPAANAKVWKLTAGSSYPPIIPWVATIKNLAAISLLNFSPTNIKSRQSKSWTK